MRKNRQMEILNEEKIELQKCQEEMEAEKDDKNIQMYEQAIVDYNSGRIEKDKFEEIEKVFMENVLCMEEKKESETKKLQKEYKVPQERLKKIKQQYNSGEIQTKDEREKKMKDEEKKERLKETYREVFVEAIQKHALGEMNESRFEQIKDIYKKEILKIEGQEEKKEDVEKRIDKQQAQVEEEVKKQPETKRKLIEKLKKIIKNPKVQMAVGGALITGSFASPLAYGTLGYFTIAEAVAISKGAAAGGGALAALGFKGRKLRDLIVRRNKKGKKEQDAEGQAVKVETGEGEKEMQKISRETKGEQNDRDIVKEIITKDKEENKKEDEFIERLMSETNTSSIGKLLVNEKYKEYVGKGFASYARVFLTKLEREEINKKEFKSKMKDVIRKSKVEKAIDDLYTSNKIDKSKHDELLWMIDRLSLDKGEKALERFQIAEEQRKEE